MLKTASHLRAFIQDLEHGQLMNRIPVVSAGILAALLTGACLALPANPEITRLHPLPGPYTQNSGLTEPRELVIDDAETFAETWRAIHRIRRPSPPLPAIDFQTNSVIIVALGQQPNGSTLVNIADVREVDGTFTIEVTRERAGENCLVTTSRTQPVDVVIVPKIRKPVRFVTEDVTRTCN